MKSATPQGAFSTLPETGFLRLPQVLKFIPVSKTPKSDMAIETASFLMPAQI